MAIKRTKLKKANPRSPTPPPAIEDDDNDDLMNTLLSQLDSQDKTVRVESVTVLNEMNLNQQADKIEAQSRNTAKNRFKARQARKAATVAQTYSPDDPAATARLEKEARDEEEAINRICKQLGVRVYEVNPDGHCLFSAIADQLALLGILLPSEAKYPVVRTAAANYIYSHPDDFLPFLPCAGGEDGYGALDDGLMTPEQFESYCTSVRYTAVWGGEPEILALSRAFNVPIHVIQGGQPPIVIHDPSGVPSERTVADQRVARISYHRKMYGLGEHYNSLRPAPSG